MCFGAADSGMIVRSRRMCLWDQKKVGKMPNSPLRINPQGPQNHGRLSADGALFLGEGRIKESPT